jgi:hypothetical protein
MFVELLKNVPNCKHLTRSDPIQLHCERCKLLHKSFRAYRLFTPVVIIMFAIFLTAHVSTRDSFWADLSSISLFYLLSPNLVFFCNSSKWTIFFLFVMLLHVRLGTMEVSAV